MYSLILMTAMAGSTDTASFGWRTGCTGCAGTVVVAGCSGNSCSGFATTYGSSCSGYACSGCSGVVASTGCCGGGALFPRLRNAITGIGHRLSCFGSCHGYSCTGYSCSGYSCHGSAYANSTCYGSCSGCHGSIVTGCSGCTGGVIYTGSSVYGGCYGSSIPSGTIIHGSSSYYPSTPTIISETPATTGTPIVSPPADKEKPKEMDKEKPKTDKPMTGNAAAAHLALTLPADAKLFVDGQLIAGQGEKRQFHTPELAAGQAYYYEFQAEFEFNGKKETESKRIVVRAGESLSESFPKLLAAAKTVAPTVVVVR